MAQKQVAIVLLTNSDKFGFLERITHYVLKKLEQNLENTGTVPKFQTLRLESQNGDLYYTEKLRDGLYFAVDGSDSYICVYRKMNKTFFRIHDFSNNEYSDYQVNHDFTKSWRPYVVIDDYEYDIQFLFDESDCINSIVLNMIPYKYSDLFPKTNSKAYTGEYHGYYYDSVEKEYIRIILIDDALSMCFRGEQSRLLLIPGSEHSFGSRWGHVEFIEDTKMKYFYLNYNLVFEREK
jgi:hypothetical protein